MSTAANPAITSVTRGIFRSLRPLPRGPHKLTREEVAASQRERLLAAIASLVAEHGYATTTITDTARHAGVSPNVFYEHFNDKQQCFLAAYDVFADALLARVVEQTAPSSDWAEFIRNAAIAYLGALESERQAARAFLLEMDAAGPQARKRRHHAFAAFAAMLRERHAQIRVHDPSLGPIPERIYLGLVLGVRALICTALEEEGCFPLTDLVPDVMHWFLATIHGATAAGEELKTA